MKQVNLSIQSAADIRRALNIGSNVGRGMPNESNRMETSDIQIFDAESRSRMIYFTTEVMTAICNIILPKAGADLLKECCKKVCRTGSINGDKKLQDNIKVVIDKLPKKSIQRQAIIAPLAKAFTNEYLYDTFGLGDKTIATHRILYSWLAKGNPIEAAVVSRVKYDPFVVKRAVKFILRDEIVQRISWGTKRIELDGCEIDFPKLVRKKIKQQIVRDYVEYYPEQVDRLGNSSFMKLVKALTASDMKAKAAVDYASGVLLYDNFVMIRKIAPIPLVDAMEAYLKGSYEKHLLTCAATNPDNAFDNTKTIIISCDICSTVHKGMAYIKQSTDEIHHELLGDCAHKIKLYQTHRIRVAVQRIAINAIMDGLTNVQALLVMDFKMKFEAEYYREKTTDFYGKKGSSWHGTMVYSRPTEQQKIDSPKELEPHQITYYDHISSGDSKQDWKAVLTYFEATIMRMKQDLPHVNTIYVQSDNARCYKTPGLLLGMFVVCQKHKVQIISFIHSGVQDGKGPIDGHFATAMKHVIRYVNRGNNVVTSVELIQALRSNGGVNNSVAEMVCINRTKLGEFEKQNAVVMKRLKQLDNQAETRFDPINNNIVSYSYSNFGDGEICSLSNIEAPGTAADHCLESDSESEYDDDAASIKDVTGLSDDDGDEQDPDVTAIGPITGCVIYGSGAICRQRLRVVSTPGNLIVDEVEDENDDPLMCQICRRMFANRRASGRHICKGVVGRRDLQYFALKYAIERIDQHDSSFQVIQMRNDAAHNVAAFSILSDIQEYDNILTCGWACTPRHGQMYGQKYIGPFKEEILNMFIEGENDKAQRRGPGRMLEALKRKHPGRLDLPSETEIRQAITMLMDKNKKGQTLSLVRKTGIAEPYRSTVMQIFVESQSTIKPADAWQKFQLKHSQPLEGDHSLKYPSKKQVTSLISSLKTKYKNKPLPGLEILTS